MRIAIAITLFTLLYAGSFAQTTYPLYENNSIPNSIPVPDEERSDLSDDGILRISKVTIPSLTGYFPEEGSATGEAVIILPGGGYTILAAGHEGAEVARALTAKGITAFVLKYRLPNDETMVEKNIGPLQDAQKAIQLVRQNASEWFIDPEKIGILGFSAGGHLAAIAGTKFEDAHISNPTLTNLRPNFMILVYPVISFDPAIGHSGSAKNLLGENPSQELLDYFSNEKHVSAQTPPSFLVHAKNDPVSIENSYVFEKALLDNQVTVATLYYESGGHGFGLKNPQSDVDWLDTAIQWVRSLYEGD